MRQPLNHLRPGTRFRVPELGITGTLLMVNECRARVRIDQPQQLVEFEGADGKPRAFRASRNVETSWTPAVLVEVLSFEPLTERDTTMATAKKTTQKTSARKTTTKKATPKKPAAAKAASEKKPAAAKKVPAKKTEGKMSALDAAAKVLGESQEPLNTKTMIERMAAKGYWSSPGGKTPHATLYSAILREINDKGKEARFEKVDRGLFRLAE